MGPVVWALDAFSKDFETHAKTAAAIRAHSPESEIHPIYILSEEMFSGRGYSSFLRAALKPRAEQNLLAVLDHELLINVRKSGVLRKPRVLVEASSNASLCTGKLLRYAKRVDAKLVAIGSQGKSALSRWFAGSFAETLIKESTLPVLVTGPHQSTELKRPRVIVIPTEFQPRERSHFEQILNLGLPIHFFHKASSPLDEIFANDANLLGGGWMSVGSLVENFADNLGENTRVRSEASAWITLARSRGLVASVATENFRESCAHAIIEYAEKLSGASPLIAVINDGTVRADHGWLPSSLMRDLIRASPYPILFAGHA